MLFSGQTFLELGVGKGKGLLGDQEPLVAFHRVARQAIAAVMHHAQGDLGAHLPLSGGEGEPLEGLGIVHPVFAMALEMVIAEVDLGGGVSLTRGIEKISPSLFQILFYTICVYVVDAQLMNRAHITLIRKLF